VGDRFVTTTMVDGDYGVVRTRQLVLAVAGGSSASVKERLRRGERGGLMKVFVLLFFGFVFDCGLQVFVLMIQLSQLAISHPFFTTLTLVLGRYSPPFSPPFLFLAFISIIQILSSVFSLNAPALALPLGTSHHESFSFPLPLRFNRDSVFSLCIHIHF